MGLTRTQRIALDLQLGNLRQKADADGQATLGPTIGDGESLLNDEGLERALPAEELYRSLMQDSPFDPTSKSSEAQERLRQLEELSEGVIIRKGALYSRQPIATEHDGMAIVMVDESGPIVDPRDGVSTSYQDLLDLEQAKLDAELAGYEGEIWQLLLPEHDRFADGDPR